MVAEPEPSGRGGRPASRLLDLAWPSRPHRWSGLPGAVRPALISIARLTVAAVLAYLLTALVHPGSVDLTGPLTALLVLQASTVSTLRMGLVRVAAVLGGVLIATALSVWFGLTWWSLGAAIAAALLVGKAFRLGEQALETPISAMLILAVGNRDLAAETRILNTLLGAGVGMLFGLLFPTALQTPAARRSVVRVAEALAAPLDLAADELAAAPPTRDQAEEWLSQSRAAARDVIDADQRLDTLRDSRRLNPRALATTNVHPVLSSALDTLERCQLAVRALFVSLRAEIPEGERAQDPYGDELRQVFGVVLRDAGDCLRAFGSLTDAEADGRADETEQALAESLEILRETRAMLTELILVRASGDSAWLLRGSILTALGQLLAELDLEQRVRTNRAWREAEDRRLAALSGPLPPLLRAALPHPERPYPRAVEGMIDAVRQSQSRQPEPYQSYLDPDQDDRDDR